MEPSVGGGSRKRGGAARLSRPTPQCGERSGLEDHIEIVEDGKRVPSAGELHVIDAGRNDADPVRRAGGRGHFPERRTTTVERFNKAASALARAGRIHV